MSNKSFQENQYQYFEHILRYQKVYLCTLLMILSALQLFSNYLQEKPLLVGGESYYYLSSAQEEIPYHPLLIFFRAIPDSVAFLIPPLLSLAIVLLFYPFARKIKISEKKMFWMVLFYILTPTFLFASMTLSSYSLFLMLTLAGVNIMLLDTKNKYFSILPFLLASWIDIFSGLLLLAGLAGYFFIAKKSKEIFFITLMVSVTTSIILNFLLLKTSFFLGPFTVQHPAMDIVSDFGSFSGVGVFSILLAVIGLIASWQKKNIPIMVSALAICITAYIFNTHTLFFLSLLLVALAAIGLVNLLEQNWKLFFLRNAVVLLILLGISFSTVAYFDRLSEYSPTAVDQKALEWIQRNTDEQAVVLSAPENSYYIGYFAKRKPVFSLHRHYRQDYQLSQDIFSAFYIDELFPLLEKNKVSIIYVSENMKRSLPPGQEFLFLLQNERFKLLYFTKDTEVWSFDEAK